jgi:hypothetical protein
MADESLLLSLAKDLFMKLRVFVFVWACFCVSNIHAQKIYTSTQLKLIFSTAPNVERNEANIKSPMRFSGFFNYSIITNIDFGKRFGISVGGEIKNIGLIMKDSIFRSKHRAYAVGIPLYLRVGNLDERWYIFAGGQYDYQFGYKEKVFVNGSKTKRIGGYAYDVNPFLSKDYRFKDPTQNNSFLNQGYNNTQIIYFTIGFMGDLDKSNNKKTKPNTAPDNTTTASYHRNH